MKCIDIYASIPVEKKLEFDQNKIEFINELTKQDGYVGFKEDFNKGFHILISWEDDEKLAEFLNSEHFHLFKGALKTISHKNEILIYNTNK